MIEDRIIRLPELKQITGLSSITLWRKEKEGIFPKRRKISKRAVGWSFAEVSRWLEKRLHGEVENISH
jgi:prophage regulatory protein